GIDHSAVNRQAQRRLALFLWRQTPPAPQNPMTELSPHRPAHTARATKPDARAFPTPARLNAGALRLVLARFLEKPYHVAKDSIAMNSL
ncbi:MAG: hypothetical protein LBK63_03370, partial [Treponema sp.]|nr:hypothetical protein [Treponema sp.]